MPASNENLHRAKRDKNDEFYTRLYDIGEEVYHYWPQLMGKKILCNCDDPRTSQFFFYFAAKFEDLGLERLTCIGYKKGGHGVKYVYRGDLNGNHEIDPEEIEVTELEGDGDFRSEESIRELDDADVVITNPPFSLFREYVAQLVGHGKKFLVIGPMNDVSTKEVFPLIKEGKVWLGHENPKQFVQPDGSIKKFGNICWFTNLDVRKRHETLPLFKTYTPEEYPKYDNYDAIDVSRTENIPQDYDGVMGVPISFLGKYCPEQFEILGITDRNNICGLRTKKYTKEDSPNYGDLNRRGAILVDGELKSTFARLLIRKKGNNNENRTDESQG